MKRERMERKRDANYSILKVLKRPGSDSSIKWRKKRVGEVADYSIGKVLMRHAIEIKK